MLYTVDDSLTPVQGDMLHKIQLEPSSSQTSRSSKKGQWKGQEFKGSFLKRGVGLNAKLDSWKWAKLLLLCLLLSQIEAHIQIYHASLGILIVWSLSKEWSALSKCLMAHGYLSISDLQHNWPVNIAQILQAGSETFTWHKRQK